MSSSVLGGNGQSSFSISPDFSHSKLAPQWLNGANPVSNRKLFPAKTCASLGTLLAPDPALGDLTMYFKISSPQGRTFQCNIETFLSRNHHLNGVLLEKYQSDRVRWHYEKILESMEESYPQVRAQFLILLNS